MQEIFIKNLIELMEKNNMTQVELAKKIGTTNVTISRYISGERKPRIEIITEIAKVFNVSIDYLLGFSHNTNDSSLKNDSITEIYKILNNLGFLNSENKLSQSQIELIEKLLAANKDFILSLKNNKNIVNE